MASRNRIYYTEVVSINGYVIIDGKSYSKEILQLITGDQDIESRLGDIPNRSLVLCDVIDNPCKLPYFLEYFYSMDINNEEPFHLSLLRVQVDSQLRLHEDIQIHQQRLYVAKTIEKLVFGELILEALVGPELGMGDMIG